MAHSVLFFGDSNTRGFGVGHQYRFATLAEQALTDAPYGPWSFRVSSSASVMRVIDERLSAAIAKHQPDVLLMQTPAGPFVPTIEYPGWVRPLQQLHRRFLARVEAAQQQRLREHSQSPLSERDILYHGLYTEPTHRWKPSSIPGLRSIREWIVARFPTTRVIAKERYLDRLRVSVDRLRQTPSMHVVFLGPLPLRPDYYPGFNETVQEWTPALASLLHRPGQHMSFIDTTSLLRLAPDSILLNDGTHLSKAGHSQVAALVVPALRTAMAAAAAAG